MLPRANAASVMPLLGDADLAVPEFMKSASWIAVRSFYSVISPAFREPCLPVISISGRAAVLETATYFSDWPPRENVQLFFLTERSAKKWRAAAGAPLQKSGVGGA